jgi:hypothetical protein
MNSVLVVFDMGFSKYLVSIGILRYLHTTFITKNNPLPIFLSLVPEYKSKGKPSTGMIFSQKYPLQYPQLLNINLSQYLLHHIHRYPRYDILV